MIKGSRDIQQNLTEVNDHLKEVKERPSFKITKFLASAARIIPPLTKTGDAEDETSMWLSEH